MFGWRKTRVITCPENDKPAAVTMKATSFALRTCSRWPEMAGCDQACLSQIAAAPHECELRTIVTRWYDAKTCHYCARPIGAIVWHERPPALLLAGVTREWREFAPQDLPGVFATAQPVCWACHIVETFRREHPEKVVERMRMAVPAHAIPPSNEVY